jgi:hypothetical protein
MQSASEITLETARGQTRFTLRQMDGITAGKLGTTLGKAYGPAFAQALSKARSDAGLSIAALFSALHEDHFDLIVAKTLRGLIAVTNGEVDTNAESKIAEIFTGHVGSLYELMFFALKLNFADVIEKIKAFLAALGATATK